MKWTINLKKKQKYGILIFKKSNFLCIEKVQCMLLLNSSFDCGLFFNFYFNIIRTYFFNPLFYSICVTNLVSSFQKSTINVLLSLNSFNFKNMIPIKFYCNMDNLDFYHINFQYGFTFSIHLQSKKITIMIV
jgi:hypothetical protein